MFSFFRKKGDTPRFNYLESSAIKKSYFIRTASWRKLDKQQIVVTDPHGPRLFTLDPWPQLIFLASDGQLTVEEFVHQLSWKYRGKTPALLDKTVLDEIDTLLNYKVIELTAFKKRPAPPFDKPQD